MEDKYFDRWIRIKTKLHFSGSLPYIKEGDMVFKNRFPGQKADNSIISNQGL